VNRSALGLLLLLGAPAGCAGYTVLDPSAGGGRSFGVPPSRNDSMWIGLEVPLTTALRADAQRLLDVELSSQSPALLLSTRLVDPTRRGEVGNRRGAYALGSAEVEVAWEVKDAAGKVLTSGAERRQLEFVPSVEESDRSAYDQIFQSISEKILLDVAAWLLAEQPPGA
jgi:hypothetical protein